MIDLLPVALIDHDVYMLIADVINYNNKTSSAYTFTI